MGEPFMVRQAIPSQRIADMIVGAIEGGSNYWLNNFIPRVKPNTKESPWYSDPSFWESEGWEIQCDYEDGVKVIDRIALQRGLDIMAEKHPRHFGDMMAETDDATTADVFIQCVILGEVVYG